MGDNEGMLSVLSPAKSLDFDSPVTATGHTEPRLIDETEGLIEIMRTKSPGDIAKLMRISEDLAHLNATRYREFTTPHTPDDSRPAVLAFNGDVYQGMRARDFDARDLTEAQKSLRILSGLYGLLRPLDLIQPHRLEMGTRLATELAGAHSLLASAGIATRTIGEASIPVWAAEPLALVLREAVTNVVRHSEARSCTIRVALDDDGAALTVTNDGVRDPAAEAGSADAITLAAPGPTHKGTASGLASLSERIEAVGGTLAAHRKRDDFTVTARVPRPPAPSTEPAQPAPAAIAQTAGEAR